MGEYERDDKMRRQHHEPNGKEQIYFDISYAKMWYLLVIEIKLASLDLVQECLNLHQLQKHIELPSLEIFFFITIKV
jgi:hypothetical protein